MKLNPFCDFTISQNWQRWARMRHGRPTAFISSIVSIIITLAGCKNRSNTPFHLFDLGQLQTKTNAFRNKKQEIEEGKAFITFDDSPPLAALLLKIILSSRSVAIRWCWKNFWVSSGYFERFHGLYYFVFVGDIKSFHFVNAGILVFDLSDFVKWILPMALKLWGLYLRNEYEYVTEIEKRGYRWSNLS